MKVQFTPQAVEDVTTASNHYAAIDSDLRQGFTETLDAAIDRITMFPRGAPPVEGFEGMRRARVRRFPYGNFYLIDESRIIVVRVLHASRGDRPDRLSPPAAHT